MAKTAMVQARVDSELKGNVELILKQLELSPSDAINLFYKQVELNGGLPFNVRVPNYNITTLMAMKEADEIANDPNAKSYSSAEEMFEDILNG